MKGISFIATHRMGDHTFRSTLAMNVVRNFWTSGNTAMGRKVSAIQKMICVLTQTPSSVPLIS